MRRLLAPREAIPLLMRHEPVRRYAGDAKRRPASSRGAGQCCAGGDCIRGPSLDTTH